MRKIVVLFCCFLIPAVYGQASRVNRVLDSCVAHSNFNGVVLIAKKGKTDYLKYTGIANREQGTKFSKDSRFHIFSVTKTFTAVLIMQLYEAHKIDLDATIATYYPEYTGEGANKITIRNLLTYSSGRDLEEMRNFLEVYSNDIWGVDTFITKYCSGKLLTTPGTTFNYSNGDYIILGKIIEKIYGKPYEVVLQEKIVQPLGMKHTDYLHHVDIIRGLDAAYTKDDSIPNRLNRPTNFYMDNFYAAGAMYSTPEDLLIFDQAIFKHTLLKKETVDLMLTAYSALGDVAIGFWVYPKTFGKTQTIFAERQGYGYGHSANWIHLVDKDLTFIILSNTNSVDLNKMREKIISAYLGE
ncbi:serine hydrolase domain-containing protein [Flavobacterium kingsejongi]|uniref:Serine hydrolase n=1 Tax=Flavobacterium kingsejongi TaxID=1678728 RepID=A0A2S1LRI2_9FLAO|nr:serine hydrolase domain-containing protein [Flavobacterium kingsejongi]AWG26298.1 serine hydrolase [Flavobacterium kingsejongi]